MSKYKNQSEKNGDNRLKVEKLYNWMTLLLNKWYPKDPHKLYKKRGSNQRKSTTLMRKKGKVHTMKNIMKMISKTSWKRWYRNRLKTMLIVTMTQTLTKVNLLRTILSSQKKAKKVQGFKTQVSSSLDRLSQDSLKTLWVQHREMLRMKRRFGNKWLIDTAALSFNSYTLLWINM